MHKRTAHRWRLAAIMTIGVFFALGSFWLLQIMHNGEADAQQARRDEPDYIVEKFSFVRMTPGGQPRYIISGAKLTHTPQDDVSEIDTPVVLSLSSEQPPMTINARHARIDHANSQVHLTGEVDIERAASPKGEHMSLKTPALTVFPDDDQMDTDQPVQMQLGSANVSGTGMHANNATQQMHLGGRAHIIYPPKAAK